MRVHIITRELTGDRVLTRLARDLMIPTGWSADERPDPTADINYYWPYLEWDRFRDFNATPTAAWFSHYDVGRAGKEKIWDGAAQAVDLRLTSAKLYQARLELLGPTAMVTPPVDLDKFVIKPHRHHRVPRVGISGFVYPGGRKGEELVKRLADSALGKTIELIASGRGWPVTVRDFTWDNLQTFYQGLDIFLCTSLVEGIPMPPLEALACGIPIVIPRAVGMMDELPEMAGIYHYEVGDYESMETALRVALGTKADPSALRDVVEPYTKEAWVETHRAAFEAHLFGIPEIEDLPAWEDRSGVFVVAYGKPARECAERLMVSLRKTMPALPVCLVSDKPIGLEQIFVEHPDTDLGARSVKTKIYDLAPAEWEYVLYLDADTDVIGDISFLFQLLQDGWELVICTNPAQYVLAREMRRPDNAEELAETFALLGSDELLQYNGGVFAFRRNERTNILMTAWHKEWDRYGKRDQAALDRALYTYPVRVFTLGRQFNCVTRYHKPDEDTAIAHYPMEARRWKGRIAGRLDGTEAWAAMHPDRDATMPPTPKKRKG